MEVRGNFVNVGIRVRPPLDGNNNVEGIKVVKEEVPVLFVVNKKRWFAFDNIFTQDSTQEEVYQKLVQPLVKEVLSGYNSTVVAYGQRGTGKTYTIGTDLIDRHDEEGFILKTLDEFFNNQEEQIEICITISYCELYNKEVYDLLSVKDPGPLSSRGFKEHDLTEKTIKSTCDACLLLKLGRQNRHIVAVKHNVSSQSHTIFTIHCKVKHENHEISAKFNLVDLASQERVIKTVNGGTHLKEWVEADCSLFALGKVIHALSAKSQNIPYENSIITSILQDSLGFRNFITLVACISPDIQDLDETIKTLDFAQMSLKIKNIQQMNAFIEHQRMENILHERSVFGSTLKRDCLFTEDLHSLIPLKKLRVLNNISYKKHQKNGVIDKNVSLLSCIPPIVTTVAESSSADPPESIADVVNNIQQLDDLNISPRVYLERITGLIEGRIVNECSSNMVSKTNVLVNSEHDNVRSDTPSKFDDNANIESTFKQSQKQNNTKNSKTEIHSSKTNFSQTTTNMIDTGPSTSKSKTRSERSLKLSVKVPLRRSLRLAAKQTQAALASGVHKQNLSETAPRNRAAKRNDRNTFKTGNSKGKPKANQNTSVLQLLNTGSVKDLQTLSSIGIKTATQIFKFRQLNGRFNELKDLAAMPAWRGNAFQRFLKQNFLKLD